MLTSLIRLSASLAVGLVLTTGSASAVSIVTGNCPSGSPCSISLSSPNNFYQVTATAPISPAAPAAFTHDYYFTAAQSLNTLTAVTVHEAPESKFFGGIHNLVVSWLAVPSSLISSATYTDALGNGTAFYTAGQFVTPLAAALSAGLTYILRVKGEAVDPGYYTLTVRTERLPGNQELPLPPALLLFGSALVGLTALGRRKRARASV